MDQIRSGYMDVKAQGSGVPLILARGIKADTLGADLGTTEADTAMERMGASIARYFGVPPAMVNVRSAYGSMTYSTTEAQGIAFARYTLEPYAGAIGDALPTTCPATTRWGGGSASTCRTSRAPSRARATRPTRAESGRAGSPPTKSAEAEGYALLGSATIASGPPADPAPEAPVAVEVNA